MSSTDLNQSYADLVDTPDPYPLSADDFMGRTQPPASRLLASRLRRAIRAGEYTQGDALPSQRALAEEHGIAQNTAREALRLLADEGLVIAEHGRGVFVRAPFSQVDNDLGRHRISETKMTATEKSAPQLHPSGPVYDIAGRIFVCLRMAFETTGYVGAWLVTDHRLVIEWQNGPTVATVLEQVLPHTSPDAPESVRGVAGLRLLHRTTDNEAELTWLPSPSAHVMLRRLSAQVPSAT